MGMEAGTEAARAGRLTFVSRKQESLHTYGVEGATIVNVYQLLGTPAWIRTALDRVLSHTGSRSPGIDGKTRSDFQTEDARARLATEIAAEMRDKSYRPRPVRRIHIPKSSDPSKLRPLGISTIKDRTVQEAVRMILEPVYEPKFHPHSYGFRPFRNAHHAMYRIHYLASRPGNAAYEWVVEGDIRDCFGAIDHGILLGILRRTISDRPFLKVMALMLKAGALEGLQYMPSEQGSPQGSGVSPLWANIYLSELDRFIAQKYASLDVGAKRRLAKEPEAAPCEIVRYADDFVIMVRGSKADAERLKQQTAEFLRSELRMELSREKTLVTHIREGFTFLGFEVRRITLKRDRRSRVWIRPSQKSVRRYRENVMEVLRRMGNSSDEVVLVKTLNAVTNGWSRYFAIGVCWPTFHRLSLWLWRAVNDALYHKHKGRRYRSWTQHARDYWIPYSCSEAPKDRWRQGRGIGVWSDALRTRAWILALPAHTPWQPIRPFGRYDPYDPQDREVLHARRATTHRRRA